MHIAALTAYVAQIEYDAQRPFFFRARGPMNRTASGDDYR